MSVYAVIACDAEQCTREDPPHGLPKSATLARQRLAAEGWHHTRAGRDICPTCWKADRQ